MTKITKAINTFFEKINLGKRYPHYITKNVFRVMLLLITLILVADLYLNDWGFAAYSVACPDMGNDCINPFYGAEYSPDICERLACNRAYIFAGETIGRDDFLVHYGSLLMFSLFFGSFAVNHIIYLWRKKKNVF